MNFFKKKVKIKNNKKDISLSYVDYDGKLIKKELDFEDLLKEFNNLPEASKRNVLFFTGITFIGLSFLKK